MKKITSSKIIKTATKEKFREQSTTQTKQQHNDFINWRAEIKRLEYMIEEQTTKRLQAQNQIIKMIKYLENNKRSKLPSRPKNDYKIPKNPSYAHLTDFNQHQITDYKNLFTTIKSERLFQIQNHDGKIVELQRQITTLRQTIDTVKRIAEDGKSQFEELLQVQNHTQQCFNELTQIVTNSLDNQTLKIQETDTKISEIQINLFNGMQDIRKTVIMQINNLTNNSNLSISAIENFIKEGLNKIENLVNISSSQFGKLEQKVKSVNDSIIETKYSIKQSICGYSPISREEIISKSSIQLSERNEQPKYYKMCQMEEKIWSLQTRMSSFERTMKLIYDEYLNFPNQN